MADQNQASNVNGQNNTPVYYQGPIGGGSPQAHATPMPDPAPAAQESHPAQPVTYLEKDGNYQVRSNHPLNGQTPSPDSNTVASVDGQVVQPGSVVVESDGHTQTATYANGVQIRTNEQTNVQSERAPGGNWYPINQGQPARQEHAQVIPRPDPAPLSSVGTSNSPIRDNWSGNLSQPPQQSASNDKVVYYDGPVGGGSVPAPVAHQEPLHQSTTHHTKLSSAGTSNDLARDDWWRNNPPAPSKNDGSKTSDITGGSNGGVIIVQDGATKPSPAIVAGVTGGQTPSQQLVQKATSGGDHHDKHKDLDEILRDHGGGGNSSSSGNSHDNHNDQPANNGPAFVPPAPSHLSAGDPFGGFSGDPRTSTGGAGRTFTM